MQSCYRSLFSQQPEPFFEDKPNPLVITLQRLPLNFQYMLNFWPRCMRLCRMWLQPFSLVTCLTALPLSHVASSIPSVHRAYSCFWFLLAMLTMLYEDFLVAGSLVVRLQPSSSPHNETFQGSVASKSSHLFCLCICNVSRAWWERCSLLNAGSTGANQPRTEDLLPRRLTPMAGKSVLIVV